MTMLRSTTPVVAVCAGTTGCGKRKTSRKVEQILLEAGIEVALVRHPMPYGKLKLMRSARAAGARARDSVVSPGQRASKC